MSHINSLGVALYTDLAFTLGSGAAAVPATYDQSGFDALFNLEDAAKPFGAVSNSFVRIQNVRDFPSMGTPPNIVKVPVYGAKQSQQIQGQSDAPSMEITLNYIPDDWSSVNLGLYVNDSITRAFRVVLLNSLCTTWKSTGTTANIGGSVAAPIQNSVYYFTGRIEALLIKPSLSDATTATLTLSMQSDFYGAYTVTAST
jgi:hypothetical protein